MRGAYLAAAGIDEQLRRAGLRPTPRRPEDVLLAQPSTGDRPAARNGPGWDTLVSTAQRYLVQGGGDEMRALARAGAQAYWSPEHRLPYLVLEGRQGSRSRRGVFFLQAHAEQAPIEIAQGAPEAAAAIERALTRRAPVVVVDEVPQRERRR